VERGTHRGSEVDQASDSVSVIADSAFGAHPSAPAGASPYRGAIHRRALEGVEMDVRTDMRRAPAAGLAVTAMPDAAGVVPGTNESPRSSVSWSAVIAGAVVSAALALALLVLCVGLKLTSVSPWVASSSTAMLGVTTIVAAVLVQVIASAVGGYVAGRLRTKWVQVHDDEVYFRDTAHGFLVWALATLLTAGFLTSAATTAIGAGTTGVVAAAAGNARLSSPREAPATTSASAPSPSATTAGAPAVPPSPPTAAEMPSIPRQDLDRARSVAAQTALWSFLALIVGAFSASVAATIGGRQRDRFAGALRQS
jgi:hypothetical protein